MTQDSIRDAIENLSGKRHVISDDALRARDEQLLRREHNQKEVDKKWDKKLAVIEEFTDSVHLLMAIFKHSSLQDIALLAANPVRILLLSFGIGVLRGVGFGIGFLIVIFGFLAAVFHSVPGDVLDQLMHFMRDSVTR